MVRMAVSSTSLTIGREDSLPSAGLSTAGAVRSGSVGTTTGPTGALVMLPDTDDTSGDGKIGRSVAEGTEVAEDARPALRSISRMSEVGLAAKRTPALSMAMMDSG